ncbi:hypothetical protein DY956_30945, partial [Pseudomonas paraeruginosa]
PINCELMVSRPFFSRQRIRCPGERPARDGGAGGSGLCGSSEREVSALLLKSKSKFLKNRELLNGEDLPTF